MLKIQEYIKNFKSISDANYFLSQEFDIESRKDKLGDDVVYTYNYGRNSDKMNGICNEARGLILDSEGQVVCQSFPRFFNHNDSVAPDLDWNTTKAETKADGTLITVYNHKGTYYAATRHHPEADVRIGNLTATYRSATEFFLHSKLPPLVDRVNEWWSWFRPHKKEYCFVFEMVGPDNRIITPYDFYDMILLTIFDKEKNIECNNYVVDTFSKAYGFSRPKFYTVSDFMDTIDLIGFLDIMDEGFVLVDDNKTRLKLKNPSWRTLKKAINAGAPQVSADTFAKLVLDGDSEDIIAFFPKYEKIINLLEDVFNESKTEMEYLWFEYKDLKTNKDFAREVSHHWLSSLLFAAYNNMVTYPINAISKIKPKKLVAETKRRRPNQFETEFTKIARRVGGYR